MKIFIIFICFVLVASACLVYSEDLNHFSLVQRSLKRAAEECAEAGALQLASDGKIDAEAAEKAALAMAELLAPGAGVEFSCGDYYAMVQLSYSENFFRLFSPSVKTISRSACYQWE